MRRKHRRLLLLALILVLAIASGRLLAMRRSPAIGLTPYTVPIEVPEPESPPRPTILLDPGHGGEDGGAVGGGVIEKNITLSIALLLRDKLEAIGVAVRMTRETDINLDGPDRARMAEEVNAELVVSIHLNSFDLAYVRGVETFYRNDCEESLEVALRLHKAVLVAYTLEGHETEDRDVRPGRFKILLLPSTLRTVLLEIGYISNRQERAVMASPSFQARLAEQLAEAIAEILLGD